MASRDSFQKSINKGHDLISNHFKEVSELTHSRRMSLLLRERRKFFKKKGGNFVRRMEEIKGETGKNEHRRS